MYLSRLQLSCVRLGERSSGSGRRRSHRRGIRSASSGVTQAPRRLSSTLRRWETPHLCEPCSSRNSVPRRRFSAIIHSRVRPCQTDWSIQTRSGTVQSPRRALTRLGAAARRGELRRDIASRRPRANLASRRCRRRSSSGSNRARRGGGSSPN